MNLLNGDLARLQRACLSMFTPAKRREYDVPLETFLSLERYVLNGIPTGGFLRSVLSNDLFMAMGRADWENAEALRNTTMFIYNEPPSECWGSPDKVNRWLKDHPKYTGAK